MKAFNFEALNEQQAELLYQLWLSQQHAEAKILLREAGVVTCAGCLDNTTYKAWMEWWINSLQIT